MGMVFRENAMKPMLKAMATIVPIVGRGLVKPSESFRPSAHNISKKPAAKRNIQAITFSFFPFSKDF
jgi:hypothetical protein